MKRFWFGWMAWIAASAGIALAADFEVHDAAHLTAALQRAGSGDRVLVYAGDYTGNWTVPAGVSLLGEPEFIPRAQVRPIFWSNGGAPILTMITSVESKFATQVREICFLLAKESAIVITGNGSGYICECYFQGNQGVQGGAIYTAASGTLYFQTNYFMLNTADADGGAICLEGMANVLSQANEFSQNKAGADGGGLAVSGSNLVYSIDDLFMNNRAVQDGGAVAVVSNLRICRVYEGWWTGGIAERDGGELVVDQAAVLIYGGHSDASSAMRNGGFAAVRNGALSIGALWSGGAGAGEHGGWVSADASLIKAEDNYVTQFRARYGAGMSIRHPAAMKGDPPRVARNTFQFNRAAKDGGGLFLANLPAIQVENNVFFLNDAGHGYGIALAADATATIANNTFAHIQYVSGALPLPVGEAIYISGANNASKVLNNIVAGHAYGVRGEANVRALVAGNDFFRTDAWGVINHPLALNRILWEPPFVQFDPRQRIGDFHLQANALSRNVAIPQYAPAIDRDGRARDAQPDRGAYEFIGP